jgi:ubiquinone biosynthesis protein UbiJ
LTASLGPIVGGVGGSIIDGERWVAQRLAFLRARLAEDISDEEQAAIEAEIGTLSDERGLTLGSARPFRRRRWLRRRNP